MFKTMFIEATWYATILSCIITFSQFYNPRIWLQCYPQAIIDRVPAKTKKEKRLTLLIGIPFLIIMFVYPLYSSIHLKITLEDSYRFYYSFINTFVITNVFNLVDLVVLDWLIFCRSPKYLILPGTKGMPEYTDYAFHAKAAFKGLKLSLIMSLITTLVCIIL